MQDPERGAVARDLLDRFVARTGVRPGAGTPRRYLWTDAFAVCTLLGLHRATGERAPLDDALALVEAVHTTLGRHRPDDPRTGWISGLDEERGRAHPTCRGLRIGKQLPERGPDEPFDERLEWERDGQYFHYLTRWMHALARAARVRGDSAILRQALELARAAHAGFVVAEDGRKRMVWKASIDLTRPQVATMGHHDPLDGLLTFGELQAAARAADLPGLDAEIADLRALCAGTDWATADPLGLGGLLVDALRQGRLLAAGESSDRELLRRILSGAARGLVAWHGASELGAPAECRLAFRELGLAIGLHALPRLAEVLRAAPERTGAAEVVELGAHLAHFVPLAGEIEAFWLAPEHRSSAAWRAHEDIDAVMLAASLAPEGTLAA